MNKPSSAPDRAMLSIYAETHMLLKLAAAIQGVTMTKLAESAIREYCLPMISKTVREDIPTGNLDRVA